MNDRDVLRRSLVLRLCRIKWHEVEEMRVGGFRSWHRNCIAPTSRRGRRGPKSSVLFSKMSQYVETQT